MDSSSVGRNGCKGRGRLIAARGLSSWIAPCFFETAQTAESFRRIIRPCGGNETCLQVCIETSKETLNNSSAAGQRIFSPIRAVQKTENTYRIPPFSEPSAGEKSLAASSCRMIQSFLSRQRMSGPRVAHFLQREDFTLLPGGGRMCYNAAYPMFSGGEP